MFCCSLWLLIFSLSLSPSREKQREKKKKHASISHNWLLFEVEYWSPSLALPPSSPSSHPSALLTSPAATLISAAVNGVPSSVQTSFWINGPVPTLGSRFGHTGGREQQRHGIKASGGLPASHILEYLLVYRFFIFLIRFILPSVIKSFLGGG